MPYFQKKNKGRAQKLQSSAVVIGTIKVNLNLVDVSLNYKAVSQFKNAKAANATLFSTKIESTKNCSLLQLCKVL